jgi:TRAP-type C4-dicarboxylate transport system permease small subunit
MPASPSPKPSCGGLHILVDFLEAASRFCNRVARFILVAASATMAVIIFLQVLFRFSIKIPLPWSEELARYLMIWIGMMGASIALHEGRHIGVDFVMEHLPGRLRRIFSVAAILGVVWFLWLMVREGGDLALINYSQSSPAMMIPMLIPYAAIPAGGAFMLIQIGRILLLTILGHKTREEV